MTPPAPDDQPSPPPSTTTPVYPPNVLYQMFMGWRARQQLARLRAEPPLASPTL